VVPMAVPRHGGEGRADGAVPGCFDVEERGVSVEAHMKDMEKGAWWRVHNGGRHGGGVGAGGCVAGK
jgi:hypothetical protein